MRIDQIEAVLTIAKCGSISKAAQKLYIQQPNLSTLLRNIEKEFNQDIFYRTPGGISLTPFGKDFISFAKPYYKQYVQLKKMGQFKGPEESILYFSVCSHHVSPARWAFAELCSEYGHKPIHLVYENETFEDIPQLVALNQYDIGIIGIAKHQVSLLSKLFTILGLDYVTLCHASLSIIVGKHHPLVKEKVINKNMEQCINYPFVLYKPIETYLRSHSSFHNLINNKSVISLPDLMTVNEVLNKSNAYSVGPYKFMFSASHHVFKSNAIELHFKDSPDELIFGFLKKSETKFSDIGKKYIEHLINLF